MSKFAIEKSKNINSNDLLTVRTLYQPILGSDAISLYQALVDLNELDNNINDIHHDGEVENMTSLSQMQISASFKKIIASGLIELFENPKDDTKIIVINKPLDPKAFSKSVLFDNYTKKVDAITQKVIFKLTNNNVHDKLGFSKISHKYQDVFLSDASLNDDFENTAKIVIKNGPKEIDEAIPHYPPVIFIELVTGNPPTKMHYGLVETLKSFGFANSSINMFINYSMETNNSIAINYIIKIARDFVKKNISSPDKVKVELLGALSNRRQRKMDLILSEKTETPITDEINDTFDSDMDLLGGI